MTPKRIALVVIVLGLLASGIVLAAQDGLAQFALTGGGGHSVVNSVVLQSSVGQSLVGRSSGGNTVLCSGWPGCPSPFTSTPTATATNTPSATPTNTSTATGEPPTHTPTTTPTSTPTTTSTNTPTATATEIPATHTPTSTATETSTPTATGTAAQTPTATSTNTPTAPATGTPTATSTDVPATPPAPILLAPADGTNTDDDTPSFDWSTVTGADQYQLQIDNDVDFSSPEVDVLTPASDYIVVSSIALDSYSWRVRARNSAGNFSDWSETWFFTITADYPIYLPLLMNGHQASSTSRDYHPQDLPFVLTR